MEPKLLFGFLLLTGNHALQVGHGRRAQAVAQPSRCVTQVDSSSITAIIVAYVSVGRQGGSLKLLHPSDRVRAALAVIRLPDVIPTFDGEIQALASFRPQNRSATS